jgi:hypothetical protein
MRRAVGVSELTFVSFVHTGGDESVNQASQPACIYRAASAIVPARVKGHDIGIELQVRRDTDALNEEMAPFAGRPGAAHDDGFLCPVALQVVAGTNERGQAGL